jgi:hypothetical protein
MRADQSVAIIDHIDVRRMLLTMRAMTRAARAISYATAVALDIAHRGGDEAARNAASDRAALLTPVAKAFSTDIGIEVASLGIQVHGGMGFIEETGAAQHLRDVRVTAIYEGTNGIQAIDLVTRKLPLGEGCVVQEYIAELRGIAARVHAANDPAFGTTGAKLDSALDDLARATDWLLTRLKSAPDIALAGATPYLRLFGNTAGGCLLAQEALAALRIGDQAQPADRVSLARFFAENIAVQSGGLAAGVMEGGEAVTTGLLPG